VHSRWGHGKVHPTPFYGSGGRAPLTCSTWSAFLIPRFASALSGHFRLSRSSQGRSVDRHRHDPAMGWGSVTRPLRYDFLNKRCQGSIGRWQGSELRRRHGGEASARRGEPDGTRGCRIPPATAPSPAHSRRTGSPGNRQGSSAIGTLAIEVSGRQASNRGGLRRLLPAYGAAMPVRCAHRRPTSAAVSIPLGCGAPRPKSPRNHQQWPWLANSARCCPECCPGSVSDLASGLRHWGKRREFLMPAVRIEPTSYRLQGGIDRVSARCNQLRISRRNPGFLAICDGMKHRETSLNKIGFH